MDMGIVAAPPRLFVFVTRGGVLQFHEAPGALVWRRRKDITKAFFVDSVTGKKVRAPAWMDTSLFVACGEPAVLRPIVEVMARHAYDGATFLLPGIPEADTENQAVHARNVFAEGIRMRLDREALHAV